MSIGVDGASVRGLQQQFNQIGGEHVGAKDGGFQKATQSWLGRAAAWISINIFKSGGAMQANRQTVERLVSAIEQDRNFGTTFANLARKQLAQYENGGKPLTGREASRVLDSVITHRDSVIGGVPDLIAEVIEIGGATHLADSASSHLGLGIDMDAEYQDAALAQAKKTVEGMILGSGRQPTRAQVNETLKECFRFQAERQFVARNAEKEIKNHIVNTYKMPLDTLTSERIREMTRAVVQKFDQGAAGRAPFSTAQALRLWLDDNCLNQVRPEFIARRDAAVAETVRHGGMNDPLCQALAGQAKERGLEWAFKPDQLAGLAKLVSMKYTDSMAQARNPTIEDCARVRDGIIRQFLDNLEAVKNSALTGPQKEALLGVLRENLSPLKPFLLDGAMRAIGDSQTYIDAMTRTRNHDAFRSAAAAFTDKIQALRESLKEAAEMAKTRCDEGDMSPVEAMAMHVALRLQPETTQREMAIQLFEGTYAPGLPFQNEMRRLQDIEILPFKIAFMTPEARQALMAERGVNDMEALKMQLDPEGRSASMTMRMMRLYQNLLEDELRIQMQIKPDILKLPESERPGQINRDIAGLQSFAKVLPESARQSLERQRLLVGSGVHVIVGEEKRTLDLRTLEQAIATQAQHELTNYDEKRATTDLEPKRWTEFKKDLFRNGITVNGRKLISVGTQNPATQAALLSEFVGSFPNARIAQQVAAAAYQNLSGMVLHQLNLYLQQIEPPLPPDVAAMMFSKITDSFEISIQASSPGNYVVSLEKHTLHPSFEESQGRVNHSAYRISFTVSTVNTDIGRPTLGNLSLDLLMSSVPPTES